MAFAAKTLREKCVKGDTHKMVGPLEDLREMWDTLDTCYERPEKYMEVALKPILEFRRYRMFENGSTAGWTSSSMTRRYPRSWGRCLSLTGRNGPSSNLNGSGEIWVWHSRLMWRRNGGCSQLGSS
jgi:hypothetical protein